MVSIAMNTMVRNTGDNKYLSILITFLNLTGS